MPEDMLCGVRRLWQTRSWTKGSFAGDTRLGRHANAIHAKRDWEVGPACLQRHFVGHRTILQ